MRKLRKKVEELGAKSAGKRQKSGKKIFTKKNLLLGFGAIALIAIAIFLANYLGFLNPYKFSFQRGGVSYYSNEYSPNDFFKEFKEAKEVYVSPEFIEGKTDQLVANSMNLWQVVLISNGQKPVQLLRVYAGAGSQQQLPPETATTTTAVGQLLYCHTNWGDTNKSEQISAEKCSEILLDSGKMKVLIGKGSEDKVVLSKGKMEIFYAKSKDVGTLNLKIMSQIYQDAAKIISRINDVIGQIG
ncbi:MAG: hypothetical protein NTZ73_03900 [Candidatus Diapherotrites archaeon]|nr:hypothetical protein [Candidatus Diapherotrites archaeon]